MPQTPVASPVRLPSSSFLTENATAADVSQCSTTTFTTLDPTLMDSTYCSTIPNSSDKVFSNIVSLDFKNNSSDQNSDSFEAIFDDENQEDNNQEISENDIPDMHRQIINDDHYNESSDDDGFTDFEVAFKEDDITGDTTFAKVDDYLEQKVSFEASHTLESSPHHSPCNLLNREPFIDNELPISEEITGDNDDNESDFCDFACFSDSIPTIPSTTNDDNYILDDAGINVSSDNEDNIKLNLEDVQSSFDNFETISSGKQLHLNSQVKDESAAYTVTEINPAISSESDISFEASFPTKSDITTSTTTETITEEDVVISCSLPTIEGVVDSSPDDDFGYRDIDTGGDTDSDGGKQSLANMVEARNDLVARPDSPETQEMESFDDDFDDFVSPVDQDVVPQAEQFDTFASAKIDDAFGEFTTTLTKPEEDGDDFGEFGVWSSGGLEDEEKTSVLPTVGPLKDNSEDAKEQFDPLLKRVRCMAISVLRCLINYFILLTRTSEEN